MTASGPQALLGMHGVNKSFGGLKALDQVSLELFAGTITTLVGPNGAGKTTLFNIVTGNIRPDSGEIRWFGRAVAGKAPWQIARMGIARSFQDLRLFAHMTIEENVLTVMESSSWLWQPGGGGSRDARRAKVASILAATGLEGLARVRAIDLAYAERKFLSLARIMATGARIWLLDEPASGLDPRSYELFFALLRSQVQTGVTICIIEHNLDIVVGISDRIAFLDRGRVLADGEPRSVLADPHLAAIYFGERTT